VLLDAIYAMKQSYRTGARWHMNRETVADVRKLKDGDGNYLWAPGLAADQPATLLGYPVLEFEDMPDIGSDSLSIAFANMAEGYQIVDRQGVRVLRDPYTAKPFVGFYSVTRVGGDVVNFEAIKLIKFGS
jgi:HK97 family phage major capsid protein